MNNATSECLASANELLASHSALVSRTRATQKHYRRQLRALPSPPHELLKLHLIASPPPSPPPSPPTSPTLPPKPRIIRQDLPPAKKARALRYQNYVPEEETIRNDYSQRYVDGGEWPQNWVLGADPEHRFEEYVVPFLSIRTDSRMRQVPKTAAFTCAEEDFGRRPRSPARIPPILATVFPSSSKVRCHSHRPAFLLVIHMGRSPGLAHTRARG